MTENDQRTRTLPAATEKECWPLFRMLLPMEPKTRSLSFPLPTLISTTSPILPLCRITLRRRRSSSMVDSVLCFERTSTNGCNGWLCCAATSFNPSTTAILSSKEGKQEPYHAARIRGSDGRQSFSFSRGDLLSPFPHYFLPWLGSLLSVEVTTSLPYPLTMDIQNPRQVGWWRWPSNPSG